MLLQFLCSLSFAQPLWLWYVSSLLLKLGQPQFTKHFLDESSNIKHSPAKHWCVTWIIQRKPCHNFCITSYSHILWSMSISYCLLLHLCYPFTILFEQRVWLNCMVNAAFFSYCEINLQFVTYFESQALRENVELFLAISNTTFIRTHH